MHTFIGTNSFPPSYWLLQLCFIPLLLVADEIRKWFSRKAEQKKNNKHILIPKNPEGGEA
jgi:hypothetical protein